MNLVRRWIVRSCLAALLGALLVTGWYHDHKPLPPGTRVAGVPVDVATGELRLLTDRSATDGYGRPVIEQQIFDATLALIAASRDLLVLDYFLLNDQHGGAAAGPAHRGVSVELLEALLARKRALPDLPILLLIDPINLRYGRQLTAPLQALQRAGIDVVPVDLDALRDSNPAWSAAWRLLIRWWAPADGPGSLPNVLDAAGPPLRLGAFARLLNFKADHRKLVIAGDGRGSLVGIVSSANPHDASSAHSNVGLLLRGAALLPLLESSLQQAQRSGWRGRIATDIVTARPAANLGGLGNRSASPTAGPDTTARVAVATEGAIRDVVLQRLAAVRGGDAIDLAMFYLTDRQVIRALLDASARGAAVRVILDPNKDAFGHERNGLPNRQVASELVTASDGAIKLRWYRTHGEQFHAKLLAIRASGRLWFTLGSANFTARNLADYNLEANVHVEVDDQTTLAASVSDWFDTLWSNRASGGVEYTADLDVYADAAQGRYWLYRLMEATGMATF